MAKRKNRGGQQTSGWLYNLLYRGGPIASEGGGRAIDIVFNHMLLGFHHFAKFGTGGAIGQVIVDLPGFKRMSYALERKFAPVAEPVSRPFRIVGEHVGRAARRAARVPVINAGMTVANENLKQPARHVNEVRKQWMRTPVGRFSSGLFSAAGTLLALKAGGLTGIDILEKFSNPQVKYYVIGGTAVGSLKLGLPAAIARTSVWAARRELTRELKRNAREQSQERGLERSVADDGEGVGREQGDGLELDSSVVVVLPHGSDETYLRLEPYERSRAIAAEMMGEVPAANEDGYELYSQIASLLEGRVRDGNALLDLETARAFEEIDAELAGLKLAPLNMEALLAVEPGVDDDRRQAILTANAFLREAGSDIRNAIVIDALRLVGADVDRSHPNARRSEQAMLVREIERSFDPVAQEVRLDDAAARVVATAVNRTQTPTAVIEEVLRGDNLDAVVTARAQVVVQPQLAQELAQQMFGRVHVNDDSPDWLRTMYSGAQRAVREVVADPFAPLSPANARILASVDANLRAAFGDEHALDLVPLGPDRQRLVDQVQLPPDRLLAVEATRHATLLLGDEPAERIDHRKVGQVREQTVDNPPRQHWHALSKALMLNTRFDQAGNVVLNDRPRATGDDRHPGIVADDSARAIALAIVEYIESTPDARAAREAVQLDRVFHDQQTVEAINHLLDPHPSLRQRARLAPGREDPAVFTPRPEPRPPKPRLGTRTFHEVRRLEAIDRRAMEAALSVVPGALNFAGAELPDGPHDGALTTGPRDVATNLYIDLRRLFTKLDTSDPNNLRFPVEYESGYIKDLAQYIARAEHQARNHDIALEVNLSNFAPDVQQRIGRVLAHQRDRADMPSRPRRAASAVKGFFAEHLGSTDDPDTVRETISEETLNASVRVTGKGARYSQGEPQHIARDILWETPKKLADAAPLLLRGVNVEVEGDDFSVFDDIRLFAEAVEDKRWVTPEAQQAALRIIHSNDAELIQRHLPHEIHALELIEYAQQAARLARAEAPSHLPPKDDVDNLVFQLQGSLRHAADGEHWRLDVPGESPGAIQLAMRQVHDRLRDSGVRVHPPNLNMFEPKAQELIGNGEDYNREESIMGTRKREELVRLKPFGSTREIVQEIVGLTDTHLDVTRPDMSAELNAAHQGLISQVDSMEWELEALLANGPGPNGTTPVDSRGRFVLSREQQKQFIDMTTPYMRERRAEFLNLECIAPRSRWRIEQHHRDVAQRWGNAIEALVNPFSETMLFEAGDSPAPTSPGMPPVRDLTLVGAVREARSAGVPPEQFAEFYAARMAPTAAATPVVAPPAERRPEHTPAQWDGLHALLEAAVSLPPAPMSGQLLPRPADLDDELDQLSTSGPVLEPRFDWFDSSGAGGGPLL